MIPQFYSNYCIGGFPSSSVLLFPPPSCYFVAGAFRDALWVASCLETGCKIHLTLKSTVVFFKLAHSIRNQEVQLCKRLPRTVSHGSVHSVYPSPMTSTWAQGAASDPHKVTPHITVPPSREAWAVCIRRLKALRYQGTGILTRRLKPMFPVTPEQVDCIENVSTKNWGLGGPAVPCSSKSKQGAPRLRAKVTQLPRINVFS